MVAAKLVGLISRDGGRFLKQKKGSSGEWYELSTAEAKAKASHAIRDAIEAKDKAKSTKTWTDPKPPPPAKRKKEPPKQQDRRKEIVEAGGTMSRESAFSLTSIARPSSFAMGGPHPPLMGDTTTSRSVQDQIQHLRSQDFRNFGMPSLSGLSGIEGIPPVDSAGPLRQPRGVPGVARRPARDVNESKQGNGSGSDNEDPDKDFLSLIDNVLGPMQSPKRKG